VQHSLFLDAIRLPWTSQRKVKVYNGLGRARENKNPGRCRPDAGLAGNPMLCNFRQARWKHAYPRPEVAPTTLFKEAHFQELADGHANRPVLVEIYTGAHN
jgi:hypothetical protein